MNVNISLMFLFFVTVGNFQSAALLVPEGCQFKHDNKPCTSYDQSGTSKVTGGTFAYWKQHAIKHCSKDRMTMKSFSMLIPCNVGQYEGVEFVCCKPKKVKGRSFMLCRSDLHKSHYSPFKC